MRPHRSVRPTHASLAIAPGGRAPDESIHGPGELLQAVPYLLGFRPTSSVVLVGIRDRLLRVTARLDLADVVDPADPAVLPDTVAAFVAGGAQQLVAAVYPGPDGAGEQVRTERETLAAVQASIDAVPAELLDVPWVLDDRWRSLVCTEPTCCPVEGTPLPSTVSSFAAAATMSGVAPLADRAALEAELAPLEDGRTPDLHRLIAQSERDAVLAIVTESRARHDRAAIRALFAAARASGARSWAACDPATAARFAVALRHLPIRDSLWMGVDSGRIDGRPLWRALGRVMPDRYAAAPLFLYGWACWRSGDGARASEAVRRALDSDEGYTAADLLLAAITSGVDPRSVPRLRLPRGRA